MFCFSLYVSPFLFFILFFFSSFAFVKKFVCWFRFLFVFLILRFFFFVLLLLLHLSSFFLK